MIRAGSVAAASSNNSSSISVAFFENTLKLTPPGEDGGAQRSARTCFDNPCAHGVHDTRRHH